MEYGLKVFTTFVAFSYFCLLCNLLVLVLLMFFKYLYLKEQSLGTGQCMRFLPAWFQSVLDCFLEKGICFLFLETFLFIIVIWVFVCYNKRNICPLPRK